MNVKQLLILNRNLTIKKVLIVNKVIPVQDIISPQKTTFEIVKNNEIKIGDLVVLKNGSVNEYLGVIQDIETKETTTLSTYPLINVTDMDYQLTSINGVVADWIKTTLTNNLVNIDDNMLKLPLLFTDYTDETTLELSLEDGNLFDALITIFKKTGIYLDFELHYNNTKVLDGIMCNIRKAGNDIVTLRYDNPLLVEKPSVELSQSQDVNKLIFKPADETQTHKDIYIFYLLDNNTISQDENSENRINGVVQSIVTYTDDDYSEGLDKIAEENLLGDNLNHQITIKILNNNGFNFKLYTKVIFIDEKRTYETYVTRIEDYNNVYKTLKLGVLRNTLTDKIKDLQKAISTYKQSTYSSSNVSGNYATKDYVSDETKLLLTNATIDNESGIFTFTRKNGTTFTIDTLLEKVVTNFTYNEVTQSLELTLEDGSVKSIPMTAFIDDYFGSEGTYINVTISNDNVISATIKGGSITKELLSLSLQDKIDKIKDYSTDINAIKDNSTLIANSNGGFKSGIGNSGSVDVTTGGAVGNLAKTTTGGAVGNETSSGLGGSIGDSAVTTSGGAVGNEAISGLGFSGGRKAQVRLLDASDKNSGIDAVQLGTGTNTQEKTLQVYDDNIYNANTHTMTVQNLEVNGENIDNKIKGYVSYSKSQSLTNNQKQLARNNIGAGTSNFTGSYNDLTDVPETSNVDDIVNNVTVISQPKPDNTTSGSEVTQYSGFGGFVAGNGAELKETENSINLGGQKMTTVTRGSGGAVGQNAKANDGGAIGNGAEATNGFSGGENAKSATDAIQLGSGTNNIYHSLQVYGDNIYNASTHTMSVQNLEVKNTTILTNLNVSGGSTSVPTPPTNDNSTKVANTSWVNTAINNAINSSGGIITLTTNTNMWELDAGLYLVNQNVRLYYNLSEYITLSSNGILQILKNSITILFNVTFSFNHIYYSYSGTANSSTGELLSPIQYYSSYGVIGITPNTNENEKMFTTIEWVNNKINIEYVASYPFPNSGNSFRIQLGNEGDLLNYNYKIILTSCSELPEYGLIDARFGNSTTDLDMSGTLIKTGAEITDWNTILFTPMGYQGNNVFELMYNHARGAELFADFNIMEFNGFVSINGSYGRGIAGAKQTVFLNRLFNNATDIESVTHLHIYLEDNNSFNGVEGQILVYRSKK